MNWYICIERKCYQMVVFTAETLQSLAFFKSLDEVSTTIKFYKNIEGFRNYPNGFVVFEHEIEGDEASIYVAFFLHA